MEPLKPAYQLEDFNYHLPERLIAQNPSDRRDGSRLLVLNRTNKSIVHAKFTDITTFLHNDDVLVFNNTKVQNARIYCFRETGGQLEIVLASRISDVRWYVISNRTSRLKINDRFYPVKDRNVVFTVAGRQGDYIEVVSSVPLTESVLSIIGEVPLPPYIKRGSLQIDTERYQTVYAKYPGAAAAPTAGLHFTDETLKKINDLGVETVFTTLHVSWGTFSPVRDNNILKHKMHNEHYVLDSLSAGKINSARAEKRRIVAIGTTSLRVLESTFTNGMNVPGEGSTDIFIYPPYTVRSADALFTNFHTPCSTLLMLVSAFAGYDLIMNTYNEAVKNEYRFFSYGDAMLIN